MDLPINDTHTHSFKDLAIKTLEDLWFGSEPLLGNSQPDDKSQLLSNIPVILGVASQRDRQISVGDFLHKVGFRIIPRTGTKITLRSSQTAQRKRQNGFILNMKRFAMS
jgi:hypothetical protein